METQKRAGNFGLSVGVIVGVILILIHGVVDMNNSSSQADPVLWLFQAVVYFIASLVAANFQYQAQRDFEYPLTGVADSGRGAAMVMCVLLWVYIVVRSLYWDDAGMLGGAGIIPFLGFMFLDFIIANALGQWGGSIVEKQHTPIEPGF